MKNKTVKVMPSFYKKMEQLEVEIEDALKSKLMRMSREAVDFSPVDTGSYVTSFSISTGSGRPRGKSSDNKPRGQNGQSMKDLGYDQLVSDINKLDLLNTTSFTFRNGSPHAEAVEHGKNASDGTGKTWAKSRMSGGYKVFAKIRNLHG
tara:strand:+ start:1218 stop:1664 length:447 start_codon:yes stop_codon:yes gene_type:complete